MKKYIPNTLDVDKLVAEYPPIHIKNFRKDKLIYIISLISEIPANIERFESQDGFIPINSKKLQTTIHNYKEYMNYLKNSGVIESDNRYIVSEKSKGYRFTDKYLTEIYEVEIIKFTLRRRDKGESKISYAAKKEYPYLTVWFDDNLGINYTEAKAYLYKNKSQLIDPKKRNPYEVINSTHIQINRFAENQYSVSIDDTIGRYHSNLTNLKSEFRYFIRYRNQSLVSIDIKNSQPYLSTILLNLSFYINPPTTISTLNITSLPYHPTYLSIPPPPMLVKNSINHDGKDIQKYTKLVANGELYEHFSNILDKKLGVKCISRKEIKSIVFTVLFTSNRFIGQKKAEPKRVFKEMFPSVYKVFAYIKRKEKNRLAILLQRIESYLILDVICKRIAKEKPNLTIYTIHDSIVTTIGNENYVLSVMYEELTKKIGLSPTLKPEYWTNTT